MEKFCPFFSCKVQPTFTTKFETITDEIRKKTRFAVKPQECNSSKLKNILDKKDSLINNNDALWDTFLDIFYK